jgi:outer membrane cobalamin receptor
VSRRALASAVVVAALSCPAVARAEPILVGPVLEGETLQPVAGAVITVAGGEARCTTGKDGRCALASVPDGPLTLRVVRAGFEPLEERVDSRDLLVERVFVMLRPGAAGEVIEVRAAPAAEPPPSQGKQELTRAELSRIPGTGGDALRAVKSLPGVSNVDAAGAGPGLLVIRGAAPEDSLITIDGIEVPIAYHFFGLTSILPTEFIDAIEFMPGGFGVEHGRATGGVLAIQTRSEQPERIEGFAETSLVNAQALVQGPVAGRKDLAFAAAIRRSTIDLLLPLAIPDDAGIAFVTAPAYYDGQLRLDWRPSYRTRLTVFGLASYDLLTLLNDNLDPNEPLATGEWKNRTGFSRLITTLAYEGDRLQNKLTFALGTTDLEFSVASERYLRFDTRRAEVRDDLRWRLGEVVDVRLGGEARYTRSLVDAVFPLAPSEGTGGVFNFSTAPPLMLNQRNSAAVLSTYGAIDLRPTPATTITAGVRLDHFTRFGDTAVGPRVQLEQRLGPRWVARAALGSYSRHAEQQEALTVGLDPELATQAVAGVDHKPVAGVTASASAFYTDRRALIELDPVLAATDPIDAYVNRGHGRSFGGELVVRARADDFFGWIAYTLSRSDRIDGGLGDRRLFDFDQTHILVLVGSYTLGKWELGGRFQYATGTPITPIRGSIYQADANVYLPVLGEINSDRFEAAHQLDVRVDRRWSFRAWELSAFLDVTNVYAHPRTLGYRYNFDFTEKEAIKELPIVPSLGVRGSF